MNEDRVQPIAARPMGRFEFRKGDPVPEWIERVETPSGPSTAGRLTFGRDMLAFSDEAGVQLWGREDGDCFMRLEGATEPVRLTGATTTTRTPHDRDYNVWINPQARGDQWVVGQFKALHRPAARGPLSSP